MTATVRWSNSPTCRPAGSATNGPEEHLLASYYGINSWDLSQRYVTVLQTLVKDRIPTEKDPATLALVDVRTKEFIPLAQTRAWNFQQGCMAHWLGTAPDSQIIYNDLRDGRFVSVVMDVHTKRELKVIDYPVSAVSPDGKEAISINFARLRITRPDYGYGGDGQNARRTVQFPEDDGLFLVDLETGKARLLISIAHVRSLVPEVPAEGIEYFNHTLFSRDGSKIFWLARATPNRNTTSLTLHRDGSNLRRCFPDGWGGSHFDWLDGDRLMITAAYDAKVYCHILFTVGQSDYQRLGNGLLDYDGHGTFSPDGRWMVIDTYPAGQLHEQKLHLMDMKTQACCRWDDSSSRQSSRRMAMRSAPALEPRGDMIAFNSTCTGSRQVYVFNLHW